MKRTISIFASALMVLIVATSCSKQGDNKVMTAGTGDLKFTIDFSTKLPEIPAPRSYTQSTAKPTTSWSGNIKDITILCVDAGTKTVKAVKTLDPATITNAPYTSVFYGIPAATYTVYAIANSGQSNIASGFSTGTDAWGTGTLIGKNIDDLLLKLTQVTPPAGVTPSTPGYTCYNAPAEIFVGSKTGVTIIPNDVTTAQAINLERVIGLMRVRIDHKTAAVNKDVDFAGAKGMIQIRRATQQWSLGTLIASSPKTATNVIYVGTGFSITDPSATGYNPTTILNLAENITAWADVHMFPGGTAVAALDEKFDLLISGTAKAGYKPSDAAALTVDTRVYWAGQVKEAVLANGILEVNCELKSAGVVTPPPVGTYGDLNITFTLGGWGIIRSVDLPL